MWSSALASAALAAAGAVVVAVAAFGGAQSASAHDYLVSTNPAADSTVTEALTEVSLTFNEPPLADASAAIAIEVHDPSGANVAHGEVSVVNSTLSIAASPTTPGAYTVLWQNVSADGHAVSGEFAFDYAGPAAGGAATVPAGGAGTAPATGPASTPATPEPTPTVSGATPVPTSASPSAVGGSGVQLPLVLIGVGTALAVVVVVALIVVIALRRRRSAG
jgi:methionine-rich copper-binding protein CopC